VSISSRERIAPVECMVKTKSHAAHTSRSLTHAALVAKVKRLAVAGHCFLDGPQLMDALQHHYPKATIVRIFTFDDLIAEIKRGDDQLVLLNHHPAGDDPSDLWAMDGEEVLKYIETNFPNQRVILVTGEAKTEEEQEQMGGYPGFSKDQVWENNPIWHKAIEAAIA